MSSSAASSASLNQHITRSPYQGDVANSAAAARFNPLFIHTAPNVATNNHNLQSRRYIASTPFSSTSQKQNQYLGSGSFIFVEDDDRSRNGKLASASREVLQVIYYLSRSGRLEHPHLLQVSVAPDQGLYLRDVKRRLAVIRGRRLPSTFAWSYKRSFKNGYVWQDLCDDDPIFPAHGCDYILKGCEILIDQRTVASKEESSPATPADMRPLFQSDTTMADQLIPCRSSKFVYRDQSPCAVIDHSSMHVSMVLENGTDAATQTEEDAKPPTHNDSDDHDKGFKCLHSIHERLMPTDHFSFPHQGSCTSARRLKATDLNDTEMVALPSSSSATESSSPYKEVGIAISSSNDAGDRSTNCIKPVADLIKSGSKTPGRPWMIKEIRELEERDDVIRIHKAYSHVENSPNDISDKSDCTSRKFKYRDVPCTTASFVDEAQHLPSTNTKSSRGKQSSALSLFQFVSCGGLDVKEQVLPISIYRLKSRDTPGTANELVMKNYMLSPEHSNGKGFINYCGSDSGKSSSIVDNLKGSSCSDGTLINSKPVRKLCDEFVSGKPHTANSHGHSHIHQVQSIEGNLVSQSPVSVNSIKAKAQGSNIPDVISITQSSLSDRSIIDSHELAFQASNVIAMPKTSGEGPNLWKDASKSSPRLVTELRAEVASDLRCSEAVRHTMRPLFARAVSDEILMNNSSPLFNPAKRHLSCSGTPLSNLRSGIKPVSELLNECTVQSQIDQGNTAAAVWRDGLDSSLFSSRNSYPSRAFSDGELSCMLSRANARIRLQDRALMEEGQPKRGYFERTSADGRVRRLAMGMMTGSSSNAWDVEKMLQNAVELSLQPPFDPHLLTVDCLHRGRRMRPDLTKTHAESCSSRSSWSPFSSSHYNCLNSFGRSPKSYPNLCHRPAPTTS